MLSAAAHLQAVLPGTTLADRPGPDGEFLALSNLDGLYPQPSGESALQQPQVQLARPLPYDLDDTNLAEYRRLAELKAGRVQIESITMRDLRARVFGDAAIVSMTAESKGTYKGKPFNEKSAGIDFFVKRNGRWQLVNSQMTTIAPQAAPSHAPQSREGGHSARTVSRRGCG